MLIASIAIIVGLSFLILVHEAGHFFAAKKAGLLVEEFGIGFPPRIFAKKIGETEYSINWLPFGGFVRVYGERTTALEGQSEGRSDVDKKRSFIHQTGWTKFVIMAAGVSINFLVGWLLLSIVLMIGAPQSVSVTGVFEGSPAAEAGLELGDSLVDFASADEFVSFTAANRGELVTLEIDREGERFFIEATPREIIPEGEGAFGAAVSDFGFASLPFFEAIKEGLTTSISAMAQIFKAIGNLFIDLFGRAKISENIVGPVGIFTIVGSLGELGFVYILQLVAIISLNLAVLNFIPFPGLDGGRILFLIIEKIKGSPITFEREVWANGISFVFLFLLMIVITARDIINLF